MTDVDSPAGNNGDGHQDDDPLLQTSRAIPLPSELPPVEPPSAGLIVQLFLVPAIIVAAVIGVYALFGRMASQEQDWRQLTSDVRSDNPHIRWRGALGLAQMLDADAQRGENSQKLAQNSDIATALAGLYQELIQHNAPSEEELKQIEFLSKAMGRMQVADVIVPVLQNGIDPTRHHDVRKHSLIGLAMLAGNTKDSPALKERTALVNQLIDISREPEPLFRHQAAFNLGLIPTPAAIERLEALLDDPDQMVRLNAAIGLARNGNVSGEPVFDELLNESIQWKLDPSQVRTQEEEARYFERMLMITNALKAIGELRPHLTAEAQSAYAQKVELLSQSTNDAVLRAQSLELVQQLKQR